MVQCFIVETIILQYYCLWQRVLYFPLTSRLRALLKTAKYRDLCNHEFLRPQPRDGVFADVYDSPAWKEFMGPPTFPVKRLGFVYCIDAIPAFAEGSHSVKPGCFGNYSLPPTERFKPENMLLLYIFPTSIKDQGAKKFYDFAAEYELNDLDKTGVGGVQVKIFTSSMDTPGRSELLGACNTHNSIIIALFVSCMFVCV